MHLINSFVSTSLSMAGTAFYAHTVSRSATEEEGLHTLSNKTHEAISGVFDTLSGLIIKVIPQTFIALALSSQVSHHLMTLSPSPTLLSISGVAGRILPFLPFIVATAPLIGLAHRFLNRSSNADNGLDSELEGLQRGRSFQKLGNYFSRSLEIAFAALLTSRLIHNDGGLPAFIGLATLIAGLVYRNDLLKKTFPEAEKLLGRVFTWEPNVVPYILGGAALVAGPSRICALFLLGFQGIRDYVLTSSPRGLEQDSKPFLKHDSLVRGLV